MLPICATGHLTPKPARVNLLGYNLCADCLREYLTNEEYNEWTVSESDNRPHGPIAAELKEFIQTLHTERTSPWDPVYALTESTIMEMQNKHDDNKDYVPPVDPEPFEHKCILPHIRLMSRNDPLLVLIGVSDLDREKPSSLVLCHDCGYMFLSELRTIQEEKERNEECDADYDNCSEDEMDTSPDDGESTVRRMMLEHSGRYLPMSGVAVSLHALVISSFVDMWEEYLDDGRFDIEVYDPLSKWVEEHVSVLFCDKLDQKFSFLQPEDISDDGGHECDDD
jgi:hypothetical protein